MDTPKLYKKHHVDRDHTSIGLFRALKKRFGPGKVFYPGSHVHITPSLVFPDVTYVDSFRNTDRFFADPNTLAFIQAKKEYSQEPVILYYHQDYNQPFPDLGQEFDLLISQYAGFVGQAGKEYLKPGGILVCNNSHGDATMASLDSDYRLVAVYRRVADDHFTISDSALESYLVPKKGVQPTRDQIQALGRGIAYTRSPQGYLFQKVSDPP